MYNDVLSAELLLEEYRRTGDVHALHESEQRLEKVIAHPAVTADLLVTAQGKLARVLRDLAAVSSDPVPVLDRAVAAAEAAAHSPAAETWLRSEHLNNLAQNLADRHERSSDPVDLDRAQATHLEAIALAVIADPRCVTRGGCATVLTLRHQLTGNTAPLAEAERLCREAIGFAAAPVHLAMAHHQLGRVLFAPWERSGGLAALREAIWHAETAAGADSSAAHRVLYLHALGTTRGVMAELTGDAAPHRVSRIPPDARRGPLPVGLDHTNRFNPGPGRILLHTHPAIPDGVPSSPTTNSHDPIRAGRGSVAHSRSGRPAKRAERDQVSPRRRRRGDHAARRADNQGAAAG